MGRLLRDGGVTMRVDGPYGEEEEVPEWTRFRTLVVFAGGIGVRMHGLSFALCDNVSAWEADAPPCLVTRTLLVSACSSVP